MATSYGKSKFDAEPVPISNSAGTSPMGSNIFIVKPDGDQQQARSHAEPNRHEPVTRFNLGRTIFRGIRCKLIVIRQVT
jgi:hypothetical protein